jgi:hypothetical protein
MFIEFFKKIAHFISVMFTFRTKSKKTPHFMPVLLPSQPSTPIQAAQALKKTVGRPKKYQSNAERQKAYRARKKQAQVVEFRKFIDASQVEAVEQFIQNQNAQSDTNTPTS